MKISVIVPFRDEEGNVVPVLAEIRRCHPDAEIIAVDDHSGDRTPEVLAQQPEVRTIRLPRHMGQSAALYSGLKAATGDVCVMMDGDGQSSATDIKRLLDYIPEYDFVNGYREDRRDTVSRLWASRFANGLRRAITGDGIRDTGGTPKAMKRACVDHLVPFDGLHRFIPALLVSAGFRCIEVPVEHRERLYGATKYTNWRRGLRGAWDLIGVRWLLGRKLDVDALGAAVAEEGDESVPDERSGSVG